jgi:hypothetical protein
VYGLHAAARLAQLDARHGGSFVDAQLNCAPQLWTEQLRSDVASVRIEDFVVLAAQVHDVDESLDLLVVAGRPA